MSFDITWVKVNSPEINIKINWGFNIFPLENYLGKIHLTGNQVIFGLSSLGVDSEGLFTCSCSWCNCSSCTHISLWYFFVLLLINCDQPHSELVSLRSKESEDSTVLQVSPFHSGWALLLWCKPGSCFSCV